MDWQPGQVALPLLESVHLVGLVGYAKMKIVVKARVTGKLFLGLAAVEMQKDTEDCGGSRYLAGWSLRLVLRVSIVSLSLEQLLGGAWCALTHHPGWHMSLGCNFHGAGALG